MQVVLTTGMEAVCRAIRTQQDFARVIHTLL
eukprot:COSAG02_NODE_13073_length_1449_cov_1.525926_3_plen_30_part_01